MSINIYYNNQISYYIDYQLVYTKPEMYNFCFPIIFSHVWFESIKILPIIVLIYIKLKLYSIFKLSIKILPQLK